MTATAMVTATATRKCGHCDASFDPSKDYQGKPHAPTRRYCTESCKAASRNAHRRAVAEWEAQNEALAVMHETERHGQLSLDPRPLPTLPPRPERGATR